MVRSKGDMRHLCWIDGIAHADQAAAGPSSRNPGRFGSLKAHRV
jgi:hypothetical protein